MKEKKKPPRILKPDLDITLSESGQQTNPSNSANPTPGKVRLLQPKQGIWRTYDGADGRLWFGTDGGVSCFDGQEFMTYTTADGLGQNNVVVACADSRGRLWFRFGFDSGVSCFDGHGFTTYTIADGLLDDRVVNILEDRDGHIWFSHLHSGLTHFDPETLQFLIDEQVSAFLLQDSQWELRLTGEFFDVVINHHAESKKAV